MAGPSRRIRSLGLREQRAWMKMVQPDFCCEVRGGLLVCRGRVRPTALCAEYAARIEYRVQFYPKVWIEEPQLESRSAEEPVPHTYEDDRPCLFLPGSNEWRSDKKLALTIIPWLSLWLFYYEVWLATGTWLGGGVHPEPSGPDDSLPCD